MSNPVLRCPSKLQSNYRSASDEHVTVEAEGGDLIENDPTFHTDVDRGLFDKLPLGKPIVVSEFAGDAGDSRDLGRLQWSVSRLGRPRRKFVFGGWPADHGSAEQGLLEPDSAGFDAVDGGDLGRSAGGIWRQDQRGHQRDHALGTGRHHAARQRRPLRTDLSAHRMLDFNLAYGGKNWGNFISANGLNSGRFLDPPEFAVMHDKGNEENLFDRVDYQFSNADSLHLNLGYTRSWFQTPNYFRCPERDAMDGVVVNNGGLDPNGNVVGPADQRSQIQTFNIAPSWTRLVSANTVFTLGGFVRRDQFNYYPSGNPFADLGPRICSGKP